MYSEHAPNRRKGAFLEATPKKQDILEQLGLILESKEFASSERLKRFLQYVIEETLAGRGEQIKAYSVGVDVFDLNSDFDPALNTSIRVTACRLRSRLEHYYFTSANDDKVNICIPKGSYLPVFAYCEKRPRAKPSTLEEDCGHIDIAEGAATPAQHSRPAVVVLPFTDLSEHKDVSNFLQGLAEEISIALVKFDNLAVLSTHSSHTEEKRMWEIAVRAGARFIISGSAQTAGENNTELRLRIHLMDAQTHSYVWSHRFEGSINRTSLFSLQDEITGQVSARIGDSFGLINRVLLREQAEKSTADLEVYEAMLYYHHWLNSLTNERFIKAKKALEQAVALDPTYAVTKAMLSDVYAAHYQWGLDIFPDALELSIELARQALEQDSNCQYAHWALAYNHYLRRDKTSFISAVSRALDINPSNTNILATAGTKLAMIGNWDTGLEMLNTALRLNPHIPCWYHCAPFIFHFIHNEFEDALAEAMKITTPGFMWGNILRTAALAQLENFEKAGDEAKKLIEIAPEFPKFGYKYLLAMFFEKSSADKIVHALGKAGLNMFIP